VEILVSERPTGSPSAADSGHVPLEEEFLPWSSGPDSLRGALIELEDSGELLEYDFDGSSGTLLPSEAEPLLRPCQWIAGLKDTSTMATPENGSHIQRTGRLVVGVNLSLPLYNATCCFATLPRLLC
jgi:hypothetical protein